MTKGRIVFLDGGKGRRSPERMMQIFDDVFETLTENPAEAAKMKARADLLSGIRSHIAGWGPRQADTPKRLGISRPRLDDLLQGKIDRFSLDDLVGIATAAGLTPRIGLDFEENVDRDQVPEKVGKSSRLSASDAARTVSRPTIDAATRRAADAFLTRVRATHAHVEAWLFGSRARGTHAEDSDADVAVILKGEPTNRFAVIVPLADAAYDVLMETGIHIQPLPLWESELEQPVLFGNPALIEAIKREGIRL